MFGEVAVQLFGQFDLTFAAFLNGVVQHVVTIPVLRGVSVEATGTLLKGRYCFLLSGASVLESQSRTKNTISHKKTSSILPRQGCLPG